VRKCTCCEKEYTNYVHTSFDAELLGVLDFNMMHALSEIDICIDCLIVKFEDAIEYLKRQKI